MAIKRIGFTRNMLGAFCILASTGAFVAAMPAHGDEGEESRRPVAAILPLVVGWYDGKEAPYTATDASDPSVAQLYGANYSPALGNAANTQAVDDIYTFTNFKQNNIIPSHPTPAGPTSTDPNYTPLWQVTQVTWVDTTQAHLLTSEAAVLDAKNQGLVTTVKTNVVVNCSVIYTPSGGLLPNAKLLYR